MIKIIKQKLVVTISGLRYFFKDHRSSLYLLVSTVIILIATFVLRIGSLQSEIIILHIALIWLAEMINTALESAVDSKVQDFSLNAKIAKDVAAAAVFIAYLFFGVNLLVSVFWN